jgi:hypothetical protein
MVVVPEVRPVTTPVLDIVATVGAEEVHAPPVVSLVNVVVAPAHTEEAPAIAAGVLLPTTAVADMLQ